MAKDKYRFRNVRKIMNKGTRKIFDGAFFIGTWPTRKLEDALDIIYGYKKDSGVNPPVNTKILSIFLSCMIIAAGVTYYSFAYTDLSRQACWMAGIFCLACLLWVTESLPLFATSILIIGLEIIFLANPGDWVGLGFEEIENPDYKFFLAPLADPIIVLFFGGFVLAKAAIKRGVDVSLASLILKIFGSTPAKVMIGMMCITAFFSMWMSNTATTTMMVAILIPLFAQIPEELNFQKGLLLSIPFAANIGGMGTPIASPPNAVAIGYLNSIGINISFPEWMFIGVPIVLLMLFLTFQIILKKYKPLNPLRKIILDAKPIDSKGKFVVFIFSTTIILWLTEQLHGLPTSVVALIPAIAFTATGLLNRKDINSLEWNILILIAGGIALGQGMSITGLDQEFTTLLPGESPYLFGIILVVTLVMSTFISNTATANLILPIAVSLAFALDGTSDGNFVREIAIGIALIASMAMALPVSTAPNSIVYAQGILTTKDFTSTGILVGMIALVIIFSSSFLWWIIF